MHIPAKVDYGTRALLALAIADSGEVATAQLAKTQDLPARFLGNILNDLRKAGLVQSQRGSEGRYRLARAADQITLAEVMRVFDGPLAEVRGLRPEDSRYFGAAENLGEVWHAVRASLLSVLESITLADVVSGALVVAPVDPSRVSRDPTTTS